MGITNSMLSPYWVQSNSTYQSNSPAITKSVVNSGQECGNLCLKTKGCNGFSVDTSNNCTLYPSKPNNNDAWNFFGNFGSNNSTSYQMTNIPTNINWMGPEQMDYPYNDIQSFGINQVSDCSTACENMPACAGFVVDDNADYCWLKSGFGAPNPVGNRNTFLKNENIIPNSPNSNWTGPEQLVDYPGNDISSMSTSKISDCSTACINNPSCKGFVTTDMGDYCWLKSNMENPTPNRNRNSYKMKSNFKTVNNTKLKECENICMNDNTCKAFSHDASTSTCKISSEQLKPTSFNTNNIVGNKKQHMALNGVYNIYQNNSCVDSSLFNPNATITNSLGLLRDSTGTPIVPKREVCANELTNNFIFGNNYEIMTDSLNNLDSSACLQSNTDGTVSKENCTYNDNQRWTYDDTLHAIRNWDGNCLNVTTQQNNVSVSTKPCKNDINQKFILKKSSASLQPNQANQSLENFVTNTNVNNYLSSNRNKADYLYKLPYSPPYLEDINDTLENYQSVEPEESTSRSLYLIYLITLVLLLVILMRR